MTRARSLLALSLLALASLASAADSRVEALLAKMRKVYESTRSAKILTDVRRFSQDQEFNLTVRTSYVAPNKVRSVITGIPGRRSKPIIFVTDGVSARTTGLPDGSVRNTGFTLDEVADQSATNLETLSFWDWRRQLSTAKGANMRESKLKVTSDSWNGKNWTVLEETVEKQKVFVRYFIDPQTSLIWRTVVSQIGSGRLIQDCKLVSVQRNVSLDPGLFVVKKGVRV